MLDSIDPNVALTSLLVAVPATVAAVASWRNGRSMRTNHGLRAGEHIELIHAKVNDLEQSQADTNELMIAHMADDRRQFQSISDQLDAQDAREHDRANPVD